MVTATFMFWLNLITVLQLQMYPKGTPFLQLMIRKHKYTRFQVGKDMSGFNDRIQHYLELSPRPEITKKIRRKSHCHKS